MEADRSRKGAKEGGGRRGGKGSQLKRKCPQNLSSVQLAGFGVQKESEVDRAIYSAELTHLFADITEDGQTSDHEGQSLPEFLRMEVGANEEGTGRHRVEPSRRLVRLVRISNFDEKAEQKADSDLATAKSVFEAYFPKGL